MLGQWEFHLEWGIVSMWTHSYHSPPLLLYICNKYHWDLDRYFFQQWRGGDIFESLRGRVCKSRDLLTQETIRLKTEPFRNV